MIPTSSILSSTFFAADAGDGNFVVLDVQPWQWVVLLTLIVVLLMVDLLVVHREAHVASTKEAAIESAVWISIGVAFTGVIAFWFGAAASGEYISGYLIEKSLSIDNVFVWALIMAHFLVPLKYQHRVLVWGIFGALVMRAIFIFAGVALIERFDWILYLFGAFLLYTAAKLVFGNNEHADPTDSKFLRLVNKVVPSTDEYDGQKLFTKKNAKRLATPLFAVLVLVEATDLVFAVDSVPAVLAVSHEEFLVFASNAFAILGLRALYFLLADMHSRFKYLQQGLAIILAFVGIKMIIAEWYHIPTALSLGVIAIVLTASIGFSLKASRLDEESERAGRAFDDSDRDDSAHAGADNVGSDHVGSNDAGSNDAGSNDARADNGTGSVDDLSDSVQVPESSPSRQTSSDDASPHDP